MEVTSIQDGIIIDHVPAGTALKVLEYLSINPASTKLALIMNTDSHRYGTKDIIKIDEDIDINLDVLGYIDPNITVNRVRDGKLSRKEHLELPEMVTDIIKCKNPRCITSVEQEVVHKFRLADREKRIYRCIYCDAEHK